MNLRHIAMIASLSVTGLVPLSMAAPTTAPAEQNGDIVTRVYDISDLLWQKTDYPVPSNDTTGAGAGLFPQQAADPNAHPPSTNLAGDYIKLIEDTVASDSWKDNGGQIGSMREINGELVISQTPENHRQIETVLESMRAQHGRMVVVRTYWLLLDPESVPPIPSGQALPMVDDKLLDAKHLYCGAQTTCFSGQTVHVTSGRKRNVLTGLTPIVGSNAVGYQPTLEQMRSGVVLQLTPHLEPESADERIVLDLQSNVTELGTLSDKISIPATTQPSDVGGTLDRMDEVSQQLRTTVRLPLGKKILVGGMTLEPAGKDAAAKQLYLVIEADAVK